MDGLKNPQIVLSLWYPDYDLILANDPCAIFEHYRVTEIANLNLKDCREYNNTEDDAYIAGLCNVAPSRRMFVFINIARCTDDVSTTALVMHEMMHLFWMPGEPEEDVISNAEWETMKVVEIIKTLKKI